MSQTVLALFAHPDDEVLGCGGTLARHAASGDRVVALFLADGETARQTRYDPAAFNSQIVRRQEAARAAAGILGCDPPRFLAFPDNRLDSLPLLDVVQAIQAKLGDLVPDVVYTHHAGDLNVDHRVAHHAVLTLYRPLPRRPSPKILAGETLSSTEWGTGATGPYFQPTVYVPISAQLDTKIAALGQYRDELAPFPHPRSIEAVRALAAVRGAQVGVAAAEAFVLVREILG